MHTDEQTLRMNGGIIGSKTTTRNDLHLANVAGNARLLCVATVRQKPTKCKAGALKIYQTAFHRGKRRSSQFFLSVKMKDFFKVEEHLRLKMKYILGMLNKRFHKIFAYSCLWERTV